ncbi:hypothetical protein [Streptomyces sp. NPDC101455]|uniref:hypothetical protein n=1 Tax=Streptomyces sp. NPDC101455 TaxID=3366142 RepID=UPI00381CC47B
MHRTPPAASRPRTPRPRPAPLSPPPAWEKTKIFREPRYAPEIQQDIDDERDLTAEPALRGRRSHS